MSPLYQLSPINKQVLQATSGLPTYLLGSFNRTVSPTKMRVTAVQSNGATFTYFVTVTGGNLPVAGQLVSVQGCITNSQFNVTNATIASVSFTNTPENGVGSFTVTKAGSFFVQTSDVGEALAPQVETGELLSTLAAGGASFSSQEVSLQDNTGPDNGFIIRAICSFPNGLPGAAIVQVYTADNNVDSDYVLLGTVGSVSGGLLNGAAGLTVAGSIFTGIRARFVRFNVNGMAAVGTSRIVGKILV